jgi:hypothetical protein
VLVTALVEEFLAELPKKRRLPYIRRVTSNLESKADWARVARIRPSSQDPEVQQACAEANAFWRQYLGALVNRLAEMDER